MNQLVLPLKGWATEPKIPNPPTQLHEFPTVENYNVCSHFDDDRLDFLEICL